MFIVIVVVVVVVVGVVLDGLRRVSASLYGRSRVGPSRAHMSPERGGEVVVYVCMYLCLH